MASKYSGRNITSQISSIATTPPHLLASKVPYDTNKNVCYAVNSLEDGLPPLPRSLYPDIVDPSLPPPSAARVADTLAVGHGHIMGC